MNKPIHYIDRETKKKQIEMIYGEGPLRFIYQDNPLSKFLLACVAKSHLFSRLYGVWQKSSFSKHKVLPFIEKYGVDTNEFLDPPESFGSFNDFFCRKLKDQARPISSSDAVLPSDGRYLFYQDISTCDGFVIKGKRFSLESLLDDDQLAQKYSGGSMVIGRLCPTDYHRFHFPCSGQVSSSRLINGPLYSVNPIALAQNVKILAENKRMITSIENESLGEMLYLQVGATNVGSIIRTNHTPSCEKGKEMGYFSFGGSAIILLFEPGRLEIDSDLLDASNEHLETLCKMGQSLACKARNL